MQLLVLSSPTAANAGLLTKVSVGVTGASLVFGVLKRCILLLLDRATVARKSVQSSDTRARLEHDLVQI